MNSAQKSERLTIALPSDLMNEVEDVKDEMKINRSELVRKAIEEFIKNHKRRRLEEIAHMVKDDYEKDKELIAFTSLDGEGFGD